MKSVCNPSYKFSWEKQKYEGVIYKIDNMLMYSMFVTDCNRYLSIIIYFVYCVVVYILCLVTGILYVL